MDQKKALKFNNKQKNKLLKVKKIKANDAY